ncbi:MAG: hypothetical protein V2I31_14745 [Mariniphaga sp.]|jgi:hypothetical protein|nr:hypothetical protein [Mariniphaga sp.]
MQFLFFTAITGIAFLFDEYFENHPGTLNELQTQNEASTGDHGTIYLFTQSINLGAKTSAQKTSDRKLFQILHNKFVQKCHQLRNHQVLKTEPEVLKQPLFLSYHHLIFRHYYFTHPDNDPLIS